MIIHLNLMHRTIERKKKICGYNREKRAHTRLQVTVNVKLEERAVKEEGDSDETPSREAN